MFEKHSISYVAHCDFCSETQDTGETDFYDAISAIKAKKWTVFKAYGEWNHQCPSCSEDAREEFREKKFEDLGDE